jgi:hypothetical protein
LSSRVRTLVFPAAVRAAGVVQVSSTSTAGGQGVGRGRVPARGGSG